MKRYDDYSGEYFDPDTDCPRQKPKLTRRQAAAARKEEKAFVFYYIMMTEPFAFWNSLLDPPKLKKPISWGQELDTWIEQERQRIERDYKKLNEREADRKPE